MPPLLAADDIKLVAFQQQIEGFLGSAVAQFVEGLTVDQRVASSRLIVESLESLCCVLEQDTFICCLGLVQSRKLWCFNP